MKKIAKNGIKTKKKGQKFEIEIKKTLKKKL